MVALKEMGPHPKEYYTYHDIADIAPHHAVHHRHPRAHQQTTVIDPVPGYDVIYSANEIGDDVEDGAEAAEASHKEETLDAERD